MQENIDQKSTKFIKAILNSTWLPIVMALSSVLIMLLAIFALADWAEASALHHGVQHILIFGSGIGVGSSFMHWFGSKRSEK